MLTRLILIALSVVLFSCNDKKSETTIVDKNPNIAEKKTAVVAEKELQPACYFSYGDGSADVDVMAPEGESQSFEIEDWTKEQFLALIEEHKNFCAAEGCKSDVEYADLSNLLKNKKFAAEISIGTQKDGKRDKTVVIYGESKGWVIVSHGYKYK